MLINFSRLNTTPVTSNIIIYMLPLWQKQAEVADDKTAEISLNCIQV